MFWLGATKRTPDVVDSHFAMYGAPFIVGARLRATVTRQPQPRIAIHFHGPWAEESVAAGTAGSVGARMRAAFERYALRRASAVIVLSEEFASPARRLGARADVIRVVPPGLTREWFTESRSEPPDNEIRLLCVRRLTPRMGHRELIAALKSLDFAVDGRPVILHLVGTGELEEELASIVEEASLGDRVLLEGGISDDAVRELAGRCHAAVIPTVALEGYGLAVIEAMAMGLPVISTGQGGLKDAMGPWARRPYIFALDDPGQLAEAIRATTSPAQHRELAVAVREHAASLAWGPVLERTRRLVASS